MRRAQAGAHEPNHFLCWLFICHCIPGANRFRSASLEPINPRALPVTRSEADPKMKAELSNKTAIDEGIKALTEQLAAGNSAALTSYLATMARFHHYSLGNVMMIARQRPDASHVAGFQTWKMLGRFVRKGEKGIAILAPMVGKKPDPETGDPRACVFGFRAVYVFDMAQTDGQELPQFARVAGDPGDTLDRLLGFASTLKITVEFAADLGGAEGLSTGGGIKLHDGRLAAETVATLAHELAHELLHKDRKTRGERNRRELEAEAVAFIVCHAIGLETGSACADYIRLYDGDAEALKDSLEAISGASRAILAGIEDKGASDESAAA